MKKEQRAKILAILQPTNDGLNKRILLEFL